MYLEIGRQNSDGRWETTNAVFPGKDLRNNFGERDLENQVHFLEVDGTGEFGVLALGCAPYNGELQAIRGLLAKFDVEYGKLNYIGELAFVPAGPQFRNLAKSEVADRSEFARGQIQAKLPALAAYFRPAAASKIVKELPPDVRAELDKLSQRKKAIEEKVNKEFEAVKPLIEARNLLSDKLRASNENLEKWDEAHGYPEVDLSEKDLAERTALRRDIGHQIIEIKRHDAWIEQRVPYNVIQKYLKLEAAAKQAKQAERNKFPPVKTISEVEQRKQNPEYVALSDRAWEAELALIEFAKLHDLD